MTISLPLGGIPDRCQLVLAILPVNTDWEPRSVITFR